MEDFTNGLGNAWESIAAFLPKLAGFLLILLLGYFVAKMIQKVAEGVLERVGFDRAVERGGVKKALAKSKYDPSSILAKVAFYAIFLFVLQLAFSVFGPNAISDMIHDVIAYLPKVFVAILIVVVAAAIAAAVKEIVEAALGGLSYGRQLAVGSSVAILVLGAFAALDQLEIAQTVVNTLFIAMVATVGLIAVVAIGGGGIQTMGQYWSRASQRLEKESDRVQNEAQGATARIQDRAQERMNQVKANASASPQ